jgi:hypothetical protein
MAASRSARVKDLDDFCTVQPLALRIVFPVQIFRRARRFSISFGGPYQP